MGWLSAIQVLLQLAGAIAKYAADRQLISAGEAKAIVEGNNATFAKLEIARAVRDSIARGTADTQRVRDKFTRQ